MGLQRLALKVRRREGTIYRWLYHAAIWARHLEFPLIRSFHRFLYYERRFRKSSWHTMKRVLYYEPLFKSICKEVGEHLYLVNGIPLIEGHLDIYVERDVTINGVTTFSGATVWDRPSLYIGTGSYVGYQVSIAVGPLVKIGRHVLIADRVSLIGYDGHPQDAIDRSKGRPAPKESGLPIIIEDHVWLCSNVTVLKGVTIGEGAIIAANSVVTRDVAPYTVVAGNPAREIKKLAPLSI
jgi:acetyltransferase-like isoleucine patch superfamily enzyme